MNAKRAKTLRAFVRYVTHLNLGPGGLPIRKLSANYRVDKSTVRMKQYTNQLEDKPYFQYPSATIFIDRRSGRAYYKHLKKIGVTREDVHVTCQTLAE